MLCLTLTHRWTDAGSSGTAHPCYCSLQALNVEWQESRQGWLVVLVGTELLHSPTQGTEVLVLLSTKISQQVEQKLVNISVSQHRISWALILKY